MARSLVPVALHGATLHAVVLDGVPHVSLRSIVDALGMDWKSQWSRLQRHDVLRSTVVITTTVAADGKTREAVCLPLDKLNGWLFGISAARVKPELRQRLVQYQRECFDVLAAHFGAGPAVQPQAPRLQATRYMADVAPDGSLTLRPWPAGTVAGTPAELASAVAAGSWPLEATARMAAACTQAMHNMAQHQARRAANLQAALGDAQARQQRNQRAREARRLRLANSTQVQAPAPAGGEQ